MIVNASTGDVPDMTVSDRDELIIDDVRSETVGTPASHGTEWLAGAGYRSALGVSTGASESVVSVAFWSKRPLAFNRTHVPLARRIGALTSASLSVAARSPRSRLKRTRIARSGSTPACRKASTV